VGWGWTDAYTPLSGNNKITYNRIQDVMETQFDGGGIYTNGQQPNSTVSNNFIRGDKTQYGALYLDNGSQGFTVSNNVVEHVAPGVPWLRLNYGAYQNNADSNYFEIGLNNTPFRFDTVNSSICHTTGYSFGKRPAAAQAIVDSSGIQSAAQALIKLFGIKL
jgi:hypothetical protein